MTCMGMMKPEFMTETASGLRGGIRVSQICLESFKTSKVWVLNRFD